MSKRRLPADSAHPRRAVKARRVDPSSFVASAEEPPTRLFSDQFAILIQCDSEQQQVFLLERFTKEGFRCRSLIV